MSILNQDSSFKFRPIAEKDKGIMLEMRNSPLVRAAMLNDKVITTEEHNIWFKNMLSDKTKDFYVFYKEYDIVGVVGFFNISKKEADWTFYLDDKVHKKGFGLKMCRMALEYFYNTHDTNIIKTQVKLDNFSSVRIHEKLGFKKKDKFIDNTHHIASFVLEKKDWIAFFKGLD